MFGCERCLGEVAYRSGHFGLEVRWEGDVAALGEVSLSDRGGGLQERFHGFADLGVGVLGADEFVAGQHDGVYPLVGRVVDRRQIDDDVVALT